MEAREPARIQQIINEMARRIEEQFCPEKRGEKARKVRELFQADSVTLSGRAVSRDGKYSFS